MRVAVVVDENSRVHDIALAMEVFDDRTPHGLPATLVRLHGTRQVIRLGPLSIHRDGDLDSLRADLVVIPGQSAPGTPPDREVVEVLGRAHTEGAVLASLCTGAFILGETGLLDGREATTHWRWCDALGQRFPRVRVQPNVLYAGGGQTWSSAGVAAGTDLLIELIRQQQGAHVAAEVARSMVTPAHRPGSQAQFIPAAREPQSGDLESVQMAMLAHLSRAWTLADIARTAGLSERTVSRHFRDQTGLGPISWLSRARMIAAKELLETTARTVDAVAHDVGLSSADLLRKHFRRQYGLSPTAHRRAMQSPTADRQAKASLRHASNS